MLPRAAASQYLQQREIAVAATDRVTRAWARLGTEWSDGFSDARAGMLATIERARAGTISLASTYTTLALAQTGQDAPTSDELNLDAFMESPPDGWPVISIVDRAPRVASQAVAAGASARTASQMAGSQLTSQLLTLFADDRRAVYQADITMRPALTGYTRMLNPPSCSRCVILAGKWFRWNQGFDRHPCCDCIHVPASEDVAGDLTTDPYAYFRSLVESEQVKAFGVTEARAIRDGADIYRAVNIGHLTKAGKWTGRGLATARSARIYGTPSRLSLQQIYERTDARGGNRTAVLRIMREQGWITELGQVPGGSIVGRFHEKYGLAVSRTVAGSNRERTLAARAAGARNVLDRETMTAAERRLFDANYRLQYARRTGTVVRSVTNPAGLRGSDADRHANTIPATDARLRELEMQYQLQIAELNQLVARGRAPEGLLTLARTLGIY